MRSRLKTGSALALLAVLAIWFFASPSRAVRQLETTRRSLRQEGFKSDLSEFDLSITSEQRSRAALLATTTRAALTNEMRPGRTLRDRPSFMIAAGKNSALVMWQLEKLKNNSTDTPWPELRESFRTNEVRLDAAVQAVLAGPIRFEPIGSGAMALLPYLADVKNLETDFGSRAMLALHEGQPAIAWTNLLAATCLATEYAPEPIEISHLVRFGCAGISFEVTWNALQFTNWSDAQLAELQRRWQAVDAWSALPETAAYSRASMADACQRERAEPLDSESLKSAMHNPRYVWSALAAHWQRVRYRHTGSYEDENGLLLYYRERELELRRAIKVPSWSDMRQLPGATNHAVFVSGNPSSRTVSMLNMRQVGQGFTSRGQSLLARASETEARRRIIVTALALERFRGRRGGYPSDLTALVPDLLPSLPVDFMDGMPLRYCRTDDGHFILYSIGLDCVDNGGQIRNPRPSRGPGDETLQFGLRQGTDLVWPRPASAAEAENFNREQQRAGETQIQSLRRP